MLGPIETCNFGAKYVVLLAQIRGSVLGLIDTIDSGHKLTVLNA